MDNCSLLNQVRPSAVNNNNSNNKRKQKRDKTEQTEQIKSRQTNKERQSWFHVNFIYCLLVCLFVFPDVSCSLIVEARKLNVNRNTGETILHKAARLGYHVSITCTTLAMFELC